MTNIAIPRKYAERYMQREIYTLFILNMSGLLYLPDNPAMSELEKIHKQSYRNKARMQKKTLLNSLEHETIKVDIKRKIYVVLYELTQAIVIDINILKKLNRDFVKKRKETIRSLEKILKKPFIEKRQDIIKRLNRLKACDKKSNPYREIDFISSWHHMFYAGLLKKLVLKVEARKLSEMLSIPMNFKNGRPRRFFSKVLQVVVFRYLHEHGKLSKEKAQYLTKEIINEYFGKIGCPNSTSLRFKDIDNTMGGL